MLNKAKLCDNCKSAMCSASQIVCLANLRVDANVISWLQKDILQLLHQPPAVVHTGAEHTGTNLALLAH